MSGCMKISNMWAHFSLIVLYLLAMVILFGNRSLYVEYRDLFLSNSFEDSPALDVRVHDELPYESGKGIKLYDYKTEKYTQLHPERTDNTGVVKYRKLNFIKTKEGKIKVPSPGSNVTFKLNTSEEIEAITNPVLTEYEIILERTTNIPYNDVLFSDTDETKYFIYQPSGGLNNQRIELEAALIFAKRLGRGLIVPMAGKHTSMSTYLKLGLNELVPMDIIFDFNYLSTGPYQDVRMVPINMTFSNFLKELRRKFPEKCSVNFRQLASKRRHGNHDCGTNGFIEHGMMMNSKRFLIYEGHFYCHYFKNTDQSEASRNVRYNPNFRDYTLLLLQKTFESRSDLVTNGTVIAKYNAIHIRRGDYKKTLGDLQGYALYRMKKQAFQSSLPIYVATEPTRDRRGFEQIMSKYKTFFFHDLDKVWIQAFKNAFRDKEGSTANDMFGIIDQLIGSYAAKFQGTGISTFTKFILFIRSNRKELFPESVPNINFQKWDSPFEIKVVEVS